MDIVIILLLLVCSVIFCIVCLGIIYNSKPKNNMERMQLYLDECERINNNDIE